MKYATKPRIHTFVATSDIHLKYKLRKSRAEVMKASVEAVRHAPPQSRGLAMGAYTVFLDMALGFGSPALGLIAGWAGPSAAFLATAIIVARPMTRAVACAAGMNTTRPSAP